jgi:chemotaxis protein methyltransferase CheR
VQLTAQAFDELRRLVYRLCGLVLGEDKAYLVRHRLEPVVREHGLDDFTDLCRELRGPGGCDLHDDIVEAITTPETSFFRDLHPFEAFRSHILPQLGARPRIWCAAASTGQEPYSVAMVLHEARQLDAQLQGAEVLATDISARVLAVAQAGEYSDRELVRGLTPAQAARFFERRGDAWVVREVLRRLVRFQRLNLTQTWSGLGTFDVIFCRNVLIYFDDETRRRVCRQLHDVLEDRGWLILGAAENLYGISEEFTSLRLGETLVYRKQ